MAYVPPLNGGRINASISGNTTGTGALISTGNMVLAGGNNITLSQNGNSINIVGGGGSINLSAGGNSANLASVTFANSNGVSFGLSNGTLTGSVAAQSAQTLGLYATGANTVGLSSSGTLDARNLNISGQGALSAGLSGSTLQLAAPAVSSVNAAGIINIASNGSNVTISAPAFSVGIATNSTVSNQLILAGGNNITLSQSTNASGATVSIVGGSGTTLSHWEYPTNAFASIGTLGQGSLSLQRILLPSALAASAAKIGGSLSVGASAGDATGSANISLRMGIYSLTGSTLTLVASGSLNNAFSWQANTSVSTAAAASLQGLRQLTVPLSATLPPGEYWAAALVSSVVTAPGATFSLYGNTQMATSPAVLSPIGSNSTAASNNYNAIPFQGIYTTATGALPNSIVRSDINYTSASNMMLANFYHAIYNATY